MAFVKNVQATWKEVRARLVLPVVVYVLIGVGFWWHIVQEACLQIHRRGWREAGHHVVQFTEGPTVENMPESGAIVHLNLHGLDGVEGLSDEEFGVQGVPGLRLMRKVEECGFKPIVHRTCPPDALDFDPEYEPNFLQSVVEATLVYSASMSLSIVWQIVWEIWRYSTGIVGTVVFCALFGDLEADWQFFGNTFTGGFPRWPRLPACTETWSNTTDWVERIEYTDMGRFGRLASEDFTAKGVAAGDMGISDIFLTELSPIQLRFSEGGCDMGARMQTGGGCVEVPEALEYDVHPEFWYDVLSGYFVEVGKERDSIYARISVHSDDPTCELGDLRVHYELQNVSETTPITLFGQMESGILQPMTSAAADVIGLNPNFDNYFFGREGHWSLRHSFDFRHYPVTACTVWSRILLLAVLLVGALRARRIWIPAVLGRDLQKVAVEDSAEAKAQSSGKQDPKEKPSKPAQEAKAAAEKEGAEEEEDDEEDDEDDEEEAAIELPPSIWKSWGEEPLTDVSAGALVVASFVPFWLFITWQGLVWLVLYGLGPWPFTLLTTALVALFVFRHLKGIIIKLLNVIIQQIKDFVTEVLTEPEEDGADEAEGQDPTASSLKEELVKKAPDEEAPRRRLSKITVIALWGTALAFAFGFLGHVFFDLFEIGRGVPERTAPWETIHRTKIRLTGVVLSLVFLVILGETKLLWVYEKKETDADYEPNWMRRDNAWNDPVDKDNCHEFRPELLRRQEGKFKASNEDVELCRTS
mmetsp:Transcript_50137/g.119346  ORF Transcript_50137/g.119346 Transcript_50137/m.119346 type:complete len:756 (+) Transcript_50137:72-2339(+)